MLKITVEIIPFGVESLTRKLGEGYIINDGTGIGNKGNYNCEFKEFDKYLEDKVKIKEFDRDRGFWELIYEALKKLKESKKR